MKTSMLETYKDEMLKIAAALRNILKVDIEIVDKNLRKIAATGKLKYDLGQIIAGNTSCRVLEKKRIDYYFKSKRRRNL